MTSQLVADPRARQQEWRHHLHRHPETAFAETATAAYLGGILAGLGYDVEHGLGGTGLVASLRRGDGIRSIGLRADMDALPITEAPGRVHGSRNRAPCMRAATTGTWRWRSVLRPCCAGAAREAHS